jgi:hypothetical protein
MIIVVDEGKGIEVCKLYPKTQAFFGKMTT